MAADIPQHSAGNIERVRKLTWSLVDEQITEGELALLDSLLSRDEQARATYIDCVQLHTDLAGHFAAQRPAPNPASAKSPVLGFLNAGMPPLGLHSHLSEDATG
jgi:hypothetical protein